MKNLTEKTRIFLNENKKKSNKNSPIQPEVDDSLCNEQRNQNIFLNYEFKSEINWFQFHNHAI